MKCYINLKSFNSIILEDSSYFTIKEAKKAKIKKASSVRLPQKLTKFSLIKSPHVHKKSREQFEMLVYNRVLFLEGPVEILVKIVNKNIINNKHTLFFQIQWQA
jgi:small subunit ribosomal protein S10